MISSTIRNAACSTKLAILASFGRYRVTPPSSRAADAQRAGSFLRLPSAARAAERQQIADNAQTMADGQSPSQWLASCWSRAAIGAGIEFGMTKKQVGREGLQGDIHCQYCAPSKARRPCQPCPVRYYQTTSEIMNDCNFELVCSARLEHG
jgi:hypothetical protein